MKTARFWVLFLAGVLLADSAIGQTAILEIAAPGKYVVTIGANGQLSVVGPVATISPGGPVVPPVVPDDDRAKLISDLINALPASDARHKTAIKFAGTMRFLADQVTKGT